MGGHRIVVARQHAVIAIIAIIIIVVIVRRLVVHAIVTVNIVVIAVDHHRLARLVRRHRTAPHHRHPVSIHKFSFIIFLIKFLHHFCSILTFTACRVQHASPKRRGRPPLQFKPAKRTTRTQSVSNVSNNVLPTESPIQPAKRGRAKSGVYFE